MSKRITLTEHDTPKSATHPGKVLQEELVARELEVSAFAKQIGISIADLQQILKGKKTITIPLAIALEKALDIEADFWLRMQVNYQIDTIKIGFLKQVEKCDISLKRKKELKSVFA